MDKILIVGHPLSGHDTVEHMVLAAGMCAARPSRREGLHPVDISSALCRANARALVEAPDADGALQQVEVGPIWQGLALDLMLGNVDQPLWGWSDPQSIVLLDYWRTIDPGITFVLVYDTPDSVLTALTSEQAAQLSPDGLRQLMHNWMACNATLLRFYLHHPSRCVLVQSRQARSAPSAWLQRLQERLQGTTRLRTDADELPASIDAPQAANPALDFLTEALVRENPDCQHLYEALQACADLPDAQTSRDGGMQPLAAWRALSGLLHDRQRQHRQVAEQHARIAALEQDLTQEREAFGSQMDQLRLTLKGHVQQHQQRTAQLEALTAELRHSQAIANGHQEQVSRLGQELDRQRQLMAEREAQLQTADDRIGQLQAAHSRQEQSRHHDQERLLDQIHKLQLELESHYLKRQELGTAVTTVQAELQRIQQLASERQVQIAELQRAQTQREQERSRQEALQKAAEDRITRLVQKVEQLQTQKQAQQAQLACDQARLQEVSSAGTALAAENTRLIAQVHSVQQQLERQYLELQAFRQAKARAEALPVGAAERVKSHLSYRLGATMIQHSRHLTGWVRLPFALLQTVRQYRREHRARASDKLPPLHKYRDAQEAERVKRHLSYRLGQTLIRHAATPLGWLWLPFALQREVKDFRLQRQS